MRKLLLLIALLPLFALGQTNGTIQRSTDGTVRGLFGTVKDTLVKKSQLPYVTPEQYGAVGNGVANDKVALQNAVNSGKTVLLTKKYFISNSIHLPSNANIVGLGDTTQVIINVDSAAFKVLSTNNGRLANFKIIGNGRGTVTPYATTRPNQHGIWIRGSNKWIIENITYFKLGGHAFLTDYADYSKHEGNDIVNNRADSCYVGFGTGTRGEYNKFINNTVTNSQYGFYIFGGNTNVVGGEISNNLIGVYAGKDENDSHSSVDGVLINHNVDYAIVTDSITSGMNFANCMIYYGNIYINSSLDVKISNCFIQPAYLTITSGSDRTVFSMNKWISIPITVDNGANTVFIDEPKIENIDNKQNSLTVDATNKKYTTVTAVIGGLLPKMEKTDAVYKTGNLTETITGLKTLDKSTFVGPYNGGFAALSLGSSGGGYGIVGYNADFTATNGLYKYKYTDFTSIIDFNSGKVSFKTASSGTAGTNITYFEQGTVDNVGRIKARVVLSTGGYTVATLPSGTIGDITYVTDALSPSFMVTVVGGGSVVTPVFYNGSTWIVN